MEENSMVTDISTSKQQSEARIYRFGRIFFNMALTCLILVVIALLSVLITPVLYLVALLVLLFLIILVAIACAICTFGFIFFSPDNPVAQLEAFTGQFATNGGDVIYDVIRFCVNAANCLSVVGILASVLGIVFVALSKGKGKAGKIVVFSITITILGGILAFQLITGGTQWQA